MYKLLQNLKHSGRRGWVSLIANVMASSCLDAAHLSDDADQMTSRCRTSLRADDTGADGPANVLRPAGSPLIWQNPKSTLNHYPSVIGSKQFGCSSNRYPRSVQIYVSVKTIQQA